MPKNDTTMQEVLVFTRLERDEQGRLVIAMYYKKVWYVTFFSLPYLFCFRKDFSCQSL